MTLRAQHQVLLCVGALGANAVFLINRYSDRRNDRHDRERHQQLDQRESASPHALCLLFALPDSIDASTAAQPASAERSESTDERNRREMTSVRNRLDLQDRDVENQVLSGQRMVEVDHDQVAFDRSDDTGQLRLPDPQTRPTRPGSGTTIRCELRRSA